MEGSLKAAAIRGDRASPFGPTSCAGPCGWYSEGKYVNGSEHVEVMSCVGDSGLLGPKHVDWCAAQGKGLGPCTLSIR
jgi:hypothetical protein